LVLAEEVKIPGRVIGDTRYSGPVVVERDKIGDQLVCEGTALYRHAAPLVAGLGRGSNQIDRRSCPPGCRCDQVVLDQGVVSLKIDQDPGAGGSDAVAGNDVSVGGMSAANRVIARLEGDVHTAHVVRNLDGPDHVRPDLVVGNGRELWVEVPA